MPVTESIQYLQLLVTFLSAIIASSGFWLWVGKYRGTKGLSRKLLIGLAHDRIVCLSLIYIERGSITQDEYENLCKFLYEPYAELGGNGTTIRLMTEVDKLPITTSVNISLKGERKDVSKQ